MTNDKNSGQNSLGKNVPMLLRKYLGNTVYIKVLK
jgi:hypothetical protein